MDWLIGQRKSVFFPDDKYYVRVDKYDPILDYYIYYVFAAWGAWVVIAIIITSWWMVDWVLKKNKQDPFIYFVFELLIKIAPSLFNDRKFKIFLTFCALVYILGFIYGIAVVFWIVFFSLKVYYLKYLIYSFLANKWNRLFLSKFPACSKYSISNICVNKVERFQNYIESRIIFNRFVNEKYYVACDNMGLFDVFEKLRVSEYYNFTEFSDFNEYIAVMRQFLQFMHSHSDYSFDKEIAEFFYLFRFIIKYNSKIKV